MTEISVLHDKRIHVCLFPPVCFCLARTNPVSLEKNLIFTFTNILSALLRQEMWFNTTTYNYCWYATSLIFFFFSAISVVIPSPRFSPARSTQALAQLPFCRPATTRQCCKKTRAAKDSRQPQVYRKHCRKPSCFRELRIKGS